MAKKANSTVSIKKLQTEVTKLKQKLASASSKLKSTSKTLKEQKNAFKSELASKINSAVGDTFAKARAEAEKKLLQRDKIVADSISKFEKEWAKKYKIASKPVKKKVKSKKTKSQAASQATIAE